MLGAGRVIAIDEVPERLAMAEAGGAETIDFSKTDVYDELMKRAGKRGPDSCIRAHRVFWRHSLPMWRIFPSRTSRESTRQTGSGLAIW